MGLRNWKINLTFWNIIFFTVFLLSFRDYGEYGTMEEKKIRLAK